jgi:hypothetical protein
MTHDDKPLFLELGAVGRQVSSFCFRLLDDLPLSAEEESALGERLVRLGRSLQRRAAGQPEVIDADWHAADELLLHASLPPV